MSRKTTLAVGIIIVILVLSSMLVGYFWYQQNQIDTSWIDKVTQYFNDAKPYPQDNNEVYLLNAYRISLFENGTNTFVNASNGNDFSSYLLWVKSRVDEQLNGFIPDSFMTKILETDKVAYLRCRLGTNFTQIGVFVWDIYFVLEDNLNQGLKGTIFIEHDVNNTRMWQSWAITK